MSKADMIKARELIKQKKFDEARAILRKSNHHQAPLWLAKLDEIDPPAPKVEPVSEETDPALAETYILPKLGQTPPPLPPAVKPPLPKKEEREIPLPLAIGCIGLVILMGVCVIGGLIIYNRLGQGITNLTDPNQGSGLFVEPATFNGSKTISYGDSVSGTLSQANDFQETWLFVARAGDQAVITMRSPTVDSLLHLYSENGDYLTEDDDGGGGPAGYDAQIAYTIPADGRYVVVANLWSEVDSGPYTLTLERQ